MAHLNHPWRSLAAPVSITPALSQPCYQTGGRTARGGANPRSASAPLHPRTLSHISMAFLYVSLVGSWLEHFLKHCAARANSVCALGLSSCKKPCMVGSGGEGRRRGRNRSTDALLVLGNFHLAGPPRVVPSRGRRLTIEVKALPKHQSASARVGSISRACCSLTMAWDGGKHKRQF